MLPTTDAERKRLALYTFMFEYFPDAWLEVVKVAAAGNDQHNPGQPMHWAREKSKDQMNTAFRHIFDYGTGTKIDTDGMPHLAKAVWRLMAQLQLDVEALADDLEATGEGTVVLQSGKKYMTRDNTVVGPIRDVRPSEGYDEGYTHHWDKNGWTWCADGRYYNYGAESPHDIVAEVVT